MTTFYNLVDQKLNWGVSFNYNPFYLLFSQPEGGNEITYLPLSYLLFCQAFFFFPILIALFRKFRFSLPFLIGTFSTLFFSVFVTDFIFWSSFHSLPLVFLLLRMKEQSSKFRMLRAVLAALLWTWTSGPLALVGSLGLLWSIKDEEDNLKIAFLVPALIFSILYTPTFPLPSFPDGARLAEVSMATFWPPTFFGPSLNPNPVNYSEYSVRLAGFLSTAVTNLLLVLALLFQIKNRDGGISKELKFILCTSVFLLVESLSTGVITQNLAPLIYGLPLLPFPWLLTSLGVLIGFGIFLNSPSNGNLPFNLGFTILSLFYLSNLVTNFDGDVIEPRRVGTLFSRRIATDLSKVIPLNLNFTGLHAASVHANIKQEEAGTVADHHLNTHWSSGAAMKGDEVLEIRLKGATDCSIVSISPGSAKTDFPRGIKVEVSDDETNYRQAAVIDNWKGPIRSTSDGLLYYGPQSDVELKLDGATEIRDLRIHQTGKDNFYYWTVAEVRCGRQ